MKTCPQCGTAFRSRRKSHKFCSRKCQSLSFVVSDEEHMRRFWDKVAKADGDKCWGWMGPVTHDGYSYYPRTNGRRKYAHIIAWEATNGSHVPTGLELDHKCRNRQCVNPLHLEPVTHRVNMLRGETVASKNASKTHCKYGHELISPNIKIVVQRDSTRRVCLLCRESHNRKRREARALLDAIEKESQ